MIGSAGTNENFLSQRISVVTISGENNLKMQNCYLHCTICCLVHSKLNSNELKGESHKNYHVNSANPHEEVKPDDLFRCFKHFLRFGKVFGIIPLDGVFGSRLSELKFRWKSLGSLYSLLIMGLLIANLIIGFMGLLKFGGRNATEWAWNAESFVFYAMGVFTHVYFTLKGRALVQVFHKWTEVDLEFTEVDYNLYRDVNLIAGAVYASAILENLLLQVIFLFLSPQSESLDGPLLRYYKKAQTHWSAFIPYHEIFSVLIFWSNKFALYAWNFVDILAIMMSRAIYYKFKALNRIVYSKIQSKEVWQSPEMWRKLVKDHDTLCHFLKVFENFLSPLLFASYAINCFYICLQLHLGLSKGDVSSPAEKVYAIWSFIHLIVRVFLVSLTGAKINDYAHQILDLFYICPQSCEGIEVERARFRIASTKIGLSGLGCFVITRPFILKIISVIFTFEIVLLQAPSACQSCTNGTAN